MTIKIHNMDQNSPEWYEARKGIVTASQMHILLTPKLKTASNDAQRTFMNKIISERINYFKEDHFQTRDMARGHLWEVRALDIYNENYEDIHSVGFMTNDKLGFNVGFSPDGLVSTDGFVEVKSRLPKYQVKTILADEVPEEYMTQIQFGFFVSERKWCDFISYSNGMHMYVKRVYPIKEYQDSIIDALESFEGQVEINLSIYNDLCSNLIKSEYIIDFEGDFGDDYN